MTAAWRTQSHIALYVLGTIISLVGTGFLIGVSDYRMVRCEVLTARCLQFLKQLKLVCGATCCLSHLPTQLTPLPQMFKPVRVLASIVFLASIALVLIAAFVLNSDVRICRTIPSSLAHISFSPDLGHQCVAFPLPRLRGAHCVTQSLSSSNTSHTPGTPCRTSRTHGVPY